ncbi:MAG TPA: YncE family protein [Sphingobacterium sp.]|nr:YncE family protein [Sphingobacterium sp.]
MNNTVKKLSKTAQSLAIAGLLAISSQSVSAQEVERSAPVGRGIYEAVFSAADGHLYVTGAGSRTAPGGALYRVDPANLQVVDSILLREDPPYGIGINNKTQTAYTTNTRTNSVSAVDLSTGKLIATFNHGGEKSHTREVLVDEKKNVVYVTDVGKESSIWVIDGKTNTFSHAIENIGPTTTGLTFAGSKDKIYVTNMGDNTVAVVNVKTRKVERTFPSGGEAPINIVSDGNRLFVTNQKSGTVTVLDKKGKLIKSIETGAGAIGIVYDPIKNRIYSANRQTGTTTVIDAGSYKVLADLATGSAPNHVKIDPKTGIAYVVNKTKGGRPQPGETPVVDTNGDTVTKIK